MALLALGLALGLAAPARAVELTITSDTTISNIVSADFRVTGSAVLTVVAGAEIFGGVIAMDTSTVNMSGGSISNGLYLQNSSTAHVTGGTVSGGTGVVVLGGTAYISGGTVTGTNIGVVVDLGTANISGGEVNGNTLAGVQLTGGTVNISAGDVFGVNYGVYVLGGTANLTGGTVYGQSAGVRVKAGTAAVSGTASVKGDDGVDVLGGTATISGGTVTAHGLFPENGVTVSGGTANITGGTVSGDAAGLAVESGTATISGGTVSGTVRGVLTNSGTTTFSGGSVSGGSYGLSVGKGELIVVGCGLMVAGGTLTGNLADGTSLNLTTEKLFSPSQLLLKNVSTSAPQLTCPPNLQVVADPGGCSTRVLLTPGAFDTCDPNPLVVGTRSDGQAVTAPYPLGTTTVTWTASNSSGLASPRCLQSIQVRPSSPVGADMNAVAVDGVATRKDQLTVKVGQQITLQMLARFTTGPWIDETSSANTVYSVSPAGGTFVTKNVWKAPASLVNKTITLYARHTIPCTQVGITDTVTVTVRP